MIFCENRGSESHTFLRGYVNLYPFFPNLFSYLGPITIRNLHMTVLDIINSVEVGVGKAVLSLWLSMKLHLRVYREPV